jgi:hypothetical protein
MVFTAERKSKILLSPANVLHLRGNMQYLLTEAHAFLLSSLFSTPLYCQLALAGSILCLQHREKKN